MPPKTKRFIHLTKARDSKRQKLEQESAAVCSSSTNIQSSSSTSTVEEITPCEASELKDCMHRYIEDWACMLLRDNQMSLSLTLHYLLSVVGEMPQSSAAELIASMIGKSERTVREWRYDFVSNGGEFSDTEQGKYQREGIVWLNEELNEAASDYVRQNAVIKGRPNLTSHSFCRWVNQCLLPNSILDPGFPRSISVETARKWLHELGFEVLDKKKGVYIDGHERDDVIQHRRRFLRQLVASGFLRAECAPSEDARLAFPSDIESPSAERVENNILIFHETTFNANDDESLQWRSPESQIIRPKSHGSGIMVSDFITEKDGYLCLTQEQYTAAHQNNSNIRMGARTLLEYGEARDGYWTGPKFMKQMESVVQIAEAKYPKEHGYRLFWIFDQSGCHMAFGDDSLNVNRMNAKEGGSQPVMHDTTYNGNFISMSKQARKPTGEMVRIPRGMIDVLNQRGKYRNGMKVDEMRKELASHPDFKNEKNKLEYFLHSRGHACHFLPKFHCEMNPIERCWAQAKRYTRAYCNYNITGLRRNIGPELDSVSCANISNYFRHAKNYMYGYLLGHKAGLELEQLVTKYPKEFKSHRRVSDVV